MREPPDLAASILPVLAWWFTEQMGYIPITEMTNLLFATFKAYALSVMLDQANMFNEKLDWGFEKPITTNQISKCLLKATVSGVEGDYIVNERYRVSLINGGLSFLSDLHHSGRIHYDPAWQENIKRSKFSITDAEAENTCRDFLHRLNFNEKQLGLIDPPKIEHWADEKGKALPFVELKWKSQVDLPHDPDHYGLTFQVSGITRTVVYFLNGLPTVTPRFPIPTNYYQLIGVPSGINTNWSYQNLPPKLTTETVVWDRLTEKQMTAPRLKLSPP